MSLAWMVSRIKPSAETSSERICFCITFGRESLMVGIPKKPNGIFQTRLQSFFLKIFRIGSTAPLRQRFRFSSSLCLAECKPEADEVDAVGGRHHEAVPRAGELDGLIPTSAAEYFKLTVAWTRGVGECGGGIRGEPIAAPFPDVPVHIVQSPRIGSFLADRMGGAIAVFECPGIWIGFGNGVAEAEKVGG